MAKSVDFQAKMEDAQNLPALLPIEGGILPVGGGAISPRPNGGAPLGAELEAEAPLPE